MLIYVQDNAAIALQRGEADTSFIKLLNILFEDIAVKENCGLSRLSHLHVVLFSKNAKRSGFFY